MNIHSNRSSLSRFGGASILKLAMAFLLLVVGTSAGAGDNDYNRWISNKWVVGNWYLALDAGAFDPGLSGTFLSGLAQFHSDRTFMINDAGDFGADSFLRTLASPQYGAWRIDWHADSRQSSIEGTAMHLEARKPSGEMMGWNKVHFTLRVISQNRVEGTINVFFLPCVEMPPFPTPLTCPDPVENAADFIPASPPDVPVTMTRIVVGQ